ncbi:hypothetical protein K151_1958 [Proteus hauseri ZMd44]|nr:hypothetical protein K151_1958 [Proteus hauseri ZMd44]
MGTYGKAAVQTALNYDDKVNLREQWTNAISKETTSKSSINKGCPKGAFLGLCELGLVKNIPSNDYNAGADNKRHAKELLALAIENPNITATECFRLYQKSNNDLPKNHNGQADVVISLLEANLIRLKNS